MPIILDSSISIDGYPVGPISSPKYVFFYFKCVLIFICFLKLLNTLQIEFKVTFGTPIFIAYCLCSIRVSFTLLPSQKQ